MEKALEKLKSLKRNMDYNLSIPSIQILPIINEVILELEKLEQNPIAIKIEKTTEIIQQDKPLPRITFKQKAFADNVLQGKTLTESAILAYDTNEPRVAQTIGSENLSKPIIKHYLELHGDAAGSKIAQFSEGLIVNKDGMTRIAPTAQQLDASKYIYDQVHGKATQRIEHKGVVLMLSEDELSE